MKKLISLLLVFIALYAQAQETPDLKKVQGLLHKNNKQFFIENKGQWPDEVLFMTKTNGMDAWITKTGVVYDFYQLIENGKTSELALETEQQTFKEKKGHVIKFNLLQCNKNIIPEGNYKQEAYYNYFIGNDKSKWASFVGLYNEAIVKNIYGGIDIRYYFDNGALRYDYIVNPNADPSQIKFNINGTDKTSIDNNGDLIVQTSLGEVKQTKLFTYQNINNTKQTINSHFALLKDGSYTFTLGTYNKSKPLIIDPLIFSTFSGGTDNDYGIAIKTDAFNAVYVSGYTNSSNYPIVAGSYAIFKNNNYDVFVTKLNSNLNTLTYSTFIGGVSDDILFDLTIDSSLNVYITGSTRSSNYPTTVNAYDTSFNNTTAYEDVFITKLNPSGSALVVSSFLGGSLADKSKRIILDKERNIYIAGYTKSTDFPKTSGAFTNSYNTSNLFITKLAASGNSLVFSTTLTTISSSLFSGNNTYYGDLAIDDSSYIYVATNGASNLLPSPGINNNFGPGNHISLLKLDPSCTTPLYLTQFGGNSKTTDIVAAIGIDQSQNVYVTGTNMPEVTGINTFPTTPGAFSRTNTGGYDVFVTKFNQTGGMVYSTLIGGPAQDYVSEINIDENNNAVICGFLSLYLTTIPPVVFPTTSNAFDTSFNGTLSNEDAFITILNETGSALLYSSYIGGTTRDYAYDLAYANNASILVTGSTNSFNFPTTPGTFRTIISSSSSDAFVFKINKCPFNLNQQPVSQSIVTNNNVSFNVIASSPTTTFQWQQNAGSGFVNLSNAGVYSGVNTNTLNINSINFSKNNYQYRCVATDSGCSINSVHAKLLVNCLFNITRQPVSQNINIGTNTSFSLEASSSTATFQWQQNNGYGFVDISNNSLFSGVNDDTLIINSTPLSFNNNSFRCIVSDNACSVVSNPISLNVNCTLAITKQPVPTSINIRNNTQLITNVNSTNATFQWQQSLGTGFTNLSNSSTFSNVNDDTLLINNAPLSLNNTRYRCVINDGPCSKISDSILLNVNCSLAINTQPVNKNIPAESNTIMSITASGFATTFQWQQNTGSGFVNLTNNSTFSNVDDDTLIINAAPKSLNNTTYRCIVNDGPCSLASSSATLNVYCVSSITRQVNNTNIIIGSNALFSVASANNNATFQWQQNEGTGFVNIYNNSTFSGTNDDSLTLIATTIAQNNNTYRCLITNGSCIDTSSVGLLTVTCILNFTSQPSSQSINNGENAQFIVIANSPNANYQWQQNTGSGFINISNNILFSGTNNDTLILNGAFFLLNNTTYRCIINLNGCYVNSNSATLIINCPASITMQPNNQSTNISNNISFIVNSNNPTAVFQWQVNTGAGFINLNNNTQFSGANNDTLGINNVSFTQNNHLYRCIINNNGCRDTSNNATLTVSCDLNITGQPVNKNVSIGTNTLFVVNSNYTLAQFQWQINNGTGFVNLSNNSTYNGCNDDSLIVNGVAMSINNTSYRCVVSYLGCSVMSNNVLLTVNCIGFIINQPNNVTANIRTNVSFAITAPVSTLFQWQQNSGSGFTNLSNSSQIIGVTDNALYLLTINRSQNSFSHRCITSYKGCTDTSNIVNLTVNCVSLISTQPINKSVNVGANTSFEIASGLINSSFQWQSNNGSGFNNINNSSQFSGANSNILNISSVSLSQNNTTFRCIVSNSGCYDTSTVASLSANCISTIINQPVNKSANVAGNTQFTINSSNINAGFQWQVNNGSGFNNITSNSQFSGTNSNTLTINSIQLAQNNNTFRCIVNNLGCYDTSNVATLTANCTSYINKQPNNIQVNIGALAFIIITSSNNTSTFQWQQNTGTGFVDLNTSGLYNGINNDTFVITATPLSFNNYGYRCIVNTNGCFDTSNIAILTVNCNLNILSQPTPSTVNSGSSSKFIIKCNSVTATYQWQQNTGTGFINIINSSLFNGAKDDTLEIVSANMSLNNNSFRCIITDGICTTTSNEANLTVNCFINFVNQPTSITKGVGQDAIFFTNTNSTTATYQWQENNGSGFVNLNNNVQYTGADTKYLTVNRVTKSQNGNSYRCIVSDGICQFYSNTVFLNTNCAPLIVIQPNNSNATSGGNVTFSITSINNLTNYQWQENNGGGFVNLSNNSQYSGANLSTLTINTVSITQNNYLYRCITNYGGCSDTSSNAKLIINCARLITTQPQSASVPVGNNAQFHIQTSGSSLNFQWQQNNGTGFINLSNFGIYNGVNKDTLTINNVNLLMNNNGYRCVAYNSTCFDTSSYAILNVINTGTKNIIENTINIYPNPNNGQFKIDGLPNNATIVITNLLGETISTQQTNNKEVTIDLNNVADGMYLVKVEADNYSMTRKITIAK
ncbi:MAG: SBBP repeat-containing protein [Bacteroidota bacterium]